MHPTAGLASQLNPPDWHGPVALPKLAVSALAILPGPARLARFVILACDLHVVTAAEREWPRGQTRGSTELTVHEAP